MYTHTSNPSPMDAHTPSSTACNAAVRALPQTINSTRELLIVGQPRFARLVAHRLETTVFDVAWFQTLAEARHALGLGTKAVVVLDDESSSKTGRRLQTLTTPDWPDELAIIVVSRDELSDADARRLYHRGASAVLHWPDTALVLPAILAALLELSESSHPAELSRLEPSERAPQFHDFNQCLETVARARLNILDAQLSPDIRAIAGTLRVSNIGGRPGTAAMIQAILSELPGVSRVEVTQRAPARATTQTEQPQKSSDWQTRLIESLETIDEGEDPTVDHAHYRTQRRAQLHPLPYARNLAEYEFATPSTASRSWN